MPSPNDPRLKAYEAQRAIDKEALRLFAEGRSLPEAYRIAMNPQPVDCDAQAAQRFPSANLGKRQMPLIIDRKA